MRATCPAHPIHLHLITLKYLLKSTYHEASSHHEVFSTPLPLHLPGTKFSNIPNLRYSLNVIDQFLPPYETSEIIVF